MLAIGGHETVLEGIVQTLVASGFRVSHVAHAQDAVAVAEEDAPLIMLVDSGLGGDLPALMTLPRLNKGAIVLWRSTAEPATRLSPPVQRAVLAELELPLERARLLVLCRYVLGRHLEAGRDENGDARAGEARGEL
ncbi:MAG TPA: hypothetical protein VKZ41_09320 [Gemmatimonadales bacterium]|nr:hypothetical protein [Gemmatimonadales bacterium]